MTRFRKWIGFGLITLSCIMTVPTIAYADEKKKQDTETTKTESTKSESVKIASDGKICKGVKIQGIDVSGMTKEEAEKVVSDYVSDLQSKKVTVSANGKTISMKMSDIDYKAVENDYVDQALNIGTVGNLIQRYKDRKDVEHGSKEYELEFTYDESKIDTFVNDNISACNISAVEPKMKAKSSSIGSSNISSQFTYTEGTTGKSANADDAIKKIKDSLKEWDRKDISVEPEVKTVQPSYTIDQLKSIDSVLSTYTTSYSSSGSARCTNISNAASKINGTVVYPGKTFSIMDKILPFTKSNGYAEAGSYLAGKVVESVGGGVCQVSTTLYNAVLNAELEIVRRNNHSMIVSYVPIAFDAMVSDTGGSDFKFKNNTNSPVYIESKISGKKITFTIYGKETRASNRTIKFENKIIKEIAPGEDVITYDNTKDTSYYKVTQSAHTGYVAELYKIVYVDGVEKERVFINKSTYKSTPRYVTKGSKKVTEKVEETEVPEESEPVATTAPAATNSASATKAPTATKAPAATKTPTKAPVVTEAPVVDNSASAEDL